jgi:hypothetical protein
VDPKSAVKKLTAAILEALTKVTVNAADFETLHAATMARRILWVGDRGLPLESLRDIGQTLVHHSFDFSCLKVQLLIGCSPDWSIYLHCPIPRLN